jgi:ABC-2 type transport system ATP-binding protein
MPETAISTTGLTRDFESVRALDGLDLEVPAGAIFGYLGPNGSGKTTTINLLLGLLEPTAGSALVLGFDTRDAGDEIRAWTGAVLDDPGVYEELTAEENLHFFGRIARLDRVEIERRSRDLLGDLGLWDRRRDRVEGWSRGMRQKLALARAMVHRPQLLFLDEPTAGLDVMAAGAVRDSLAALARAEGVTIFLTTHDMAEAERLCASVAVIRDGQLVTVGSPDVLRSRTRGPHLDIVGRGFTGELVMRLQAHPQVVSAELTEGRLVIELREDVPASSLVRLVVESGAEVEEVRRGQANLEEVFVTLMRETPSGDTAGEGPPGEAASGEGSS